MTLSKTRGQLRAELQNAKSTIEDLERDIDELIDEALRESKKGNHYRSARVLEKLQRTVEVVGRMNEFLGEASYAAYVLRSVQYRQFTFDPLPSEEELVKFFLPARSSGAQLTRLAEICILEAVQAVSLYLADCWRIELEVEEYPVPEILARDADWKKRLAGLEVEHGSCFGRAVNAICYVDEWFRASQPSRSGRHSSEAGGWTTQPTGEMGDMVAANLASKLDECLADLLPRRDDSEEETPGSLHPASSRSQIERAAADAVGRMFPALGVNRARDVRRSARHAGRTAEK